MKIKLYQVHVYDRYDDTIHSGAHERVQEAYVYGSNDNSTWYELGKQSTATNNSAYTDDTPAIITINASTAYKYFIIQPTTLQKQIAYASYGQVMYYGYEETNTTGDLSLDTTITSKYNTPDLTSASLYIDGKKSGSTPTDYSGSSISVTNNGSWDSTEKSWTLSGAATSNIVSGDLGFEGDQPHSVSAWVKADVLNGDGLFHVGTAEGEGDAASRVGFVDDSHISWGGEDHFFSNAEWHNVTYTYNGEGSDKKLYLDGRLVGTAANEDTFGDYPPFAMSGYSEYGYTVSAGSDDNGGWGKAWKAFNDVAAYNASDSYLGTFTFPSGNPDTTNGKFGPNGGENDTNGAPGDWLKIELPHSLVLNSMAIIPRYSTSYESERQQKSGNVWASNDNTTWVSLTSWTNRTTGTDPITTWLDSDQYSYIVTNATKGYKYFALQWTQTNGWNQAAIGNMKLFGHRENDLVRFPDPTNVLKYPHVAMTGPAQRGYVATASSKVNNDEQYGAWGAFNGNVEKSTYEGWGSEFDTYDNANPSLAVTSGSLATQFNSRYGDYINIKLPRKILLSKIHTFPRAPSSTVRTYEHPDAGYLYGSNDGFSTFQEIYSFDGVTVSSTYGVPVIHTIPSSHLGVNLIAYDEYRFQVTKLKGQNRFAVVSEMELYGTEEDADVIARVGDGYDGKVRNLRVFSTALSDDRVQEIFDADKDEFGLAKSSVSVYRGHLGIGTTEPKAALTVMDEVAELEEFPPRAMTAAETYMEGHGVFKASASSFVDTSVLSGVWTQNIYPWYAFNKTSTYGWVSTSSVYTNGLADSDSDNRFGILGEWLEIEMPSKIKLKHFTLSLGYDEVNPSGTNTSRFPKVFNLYKSNDGVMWTTAMEITTPTAPAEGAYGTTYTYNINESEYYSRYLIQVKQTHSNTSGYTNPSSHAAIGEWRLFGTREQGASTLHNGELTLTRNLTVPRIGPALDADDTPRRDRLVV